MEKLFMPKAFLKMAGERMHAPHPTTLYLLLAISYRKHQKSDIFQSLSTITFVLFTKRQSQKGGGRHAPIAHRHISDVTN